MPLQPALAAAAARVAPAHGARRPKPPRR
jgi:hypothetical protein